MYDFEFYLQCFTVCLLKLIPPSSESNFWLVKAYQLLASITGRTVFACGKGPERDTKQRFQVNVLNKSKGSTVPMSG